MATDTFYGTGRRKSAAARVWVGEGSGKITINGRELEDYLPRATNCLIVMDPLYVTDLEGKVDIKATVSGGGLTGQAGAIRHGLGRALTLMDPDLRPALKKAGHLTRDARAKERKKYGQPGARKRYQYSKR